MNTLRAQINTALDALIEESSGFVFQRLAYQCLRERWPSLASVAERADLGEDAITILGEASDGIIRSLACSLTAEWAKVSSDAAKIAAKRADIQEFIFATPKTITEKDKKLWTERILKQYGWKLVVIEKAEFISILERPEAHWIREQHLNIQEPIRLGTGFIEKLESLRSSIEYLDGGAEKRNRSKMLQRVRSFWVQGILEASLHKMLFIELLKIEVPEALAKRPWDVVLAQSGQARRMLPPEKTILEVFDEANHVLLMLGAPGSGKTTTLLKLASNCIARAEDDDLRPIPVVFNLSSWANKGERLEDWILGELNLKYQVPKSVARKWMENNALLLLLDGLDEIIIEKRSACVDAINIFRSDFGLTDIVVCSRSEEYEALVTKLALDTAILLQPLNSTQIEEYIRSLGPTHSGIRSFLGTDPGLMTLAKSPLMLSIIAVTFEDESMPLVKGATIELQRRLLFATYVKQMFARKGRSGGALAYPATLTMLWLGWIASAMDRRKQSELFIEGIQPNWLSPVYLKLYALAARLVGMAAFFIGTVIYDISFLPLLDGYTPLEAVIAGVAYGYAFAITFLLGTLLPEFTTKWFSALCATICGGVFIVLFENSLRFHVSDFQTFCVLMLFPLPTALAGMYASNMQEIRIVEEISWSAGRVKRSFWTLARIYLVVVTLAGLVYLINHVVSGPSLNIGTGKSEIGGMTNERSTKMDSGGEARQADGAVDNGRRDVSLTTNNTKVDSLQPHPLNWDAIAKNVVSVIALPFALLGFIWVAGLSSDEIPELRKRPNQGIRRSARNAVFVGCSVTICTLICLIMLTGGARVLWGWCLQIAFNLGLLSGLFLGGGTPCIQHVLLRLTVWCLRFGPLNYPAFLDHCTERILLRRVGGGYVFLHRGLLEYFASHR